jgi:hypothetical protein
VQRVEGLEPLAQVRVELGGGQLHGGSLRPSLAATRVRFGLL